MSTLCPSVSARYRKTRCVLYLEYQLSFCAGAAANDSLARRDRMLLHLHLGQAMDLLPIIRRKGEESFEWGITPKNTDVSPRVSRASFCCPLQRARSRRTPAGAVPGRSCLRSVRPPLELYWEKEAPQRRSGSDAGLSRGIPAPGGAGARLSRSFPAASCRPPPHVTPPGPKMAAGPRAHSRRGHRARLQDGVQWRPSETA